MFELHGLWLLGGFAVVYFVGVFTSQWAKDKINGVPSTLRSALKATESAAVKELAAARDKIVADTATLISRGKAAASAEIAKVEGRVDPVPVPAVPVVPLPADPASAAAPAAPRAV